MDVRRRRKEKLSLYLHPEDSADCLALAEIETVPRKKRGSYIGRL
nr:plasmid partitioning/stability family protein [Salmonella enterica]